MLIFVILTVIYDKLIFRNRFSICLTSLTGATESLATKWWFRRTWGYCGPRLRPPAGASSIRMADLETIDSGQGGGWPGATIALLERTLPWRRPERLGGRPRLRPRSIA